MLSTGMRGNGTRSQTKKTVDTRIRDVYGHPPSTSLMSSPDTLSRCDKDKVSGEDVREVDEGG